MESPQTRLGAVLAPMGTVPSEQLAQFHDLRQNFDLQLPAESLIHRRASHLASVETIQELDELETSSL